MPTRVEYKPRNSAAHVPHLHPSRPAMQVVSVEDDDPFDMEMLSAALRRQSKGLSQSSSSGMAKMVMEERGCPWETAGDDGKITPRLEPIGKRIQGVPPSLSYSRTSRPTKSTKTKKQKPQTQRPSSENHHISWRGGHHGTPSRSKTASVVRRGKQQNDSKQRQHHTRSVDAHGSRALSTRARPFPSQQAKPRTPSRCKRDWNFDTTIQRDVPNKKRPITAQEINRKVQSLIQQSSNPGGRVQHFLPDPWSLR